MSGQLRGIITLRRALTADPIQRTTSTQNLPKSSLTQERLTNLALMHVHKDIVATVVDDKKKTHAALC